MIVWAYFDEAGRVLADSTFADEAEAWRVALGWPTGGEVMEAKARGCRVVRVMVEEVSDDAG
jgi:hypothetical protein